MRLFDLRYACCLVTVFIMFICGHLWRFKDYVVDEELTGGFCKCRRQPKTTSGKTVKFENTTCGESSFRRGSGQKVIGFSFYEHDDARLKERKQNKSWVNPPYFRGVEENLDLVASLYPGWTVRLYHDLDPDDPLMETLCSYVCKYHYFDLCDVNNLPSIFLKGAGAGSMFPMLWRFFPTLDPQVDIYMSRDLDSKINARESAAVSEFVQSGAAIHSMRDNPYHDNPLMGCSWGANLMGENIRKTWGSSWEKIRNDKLTFSSRKVKGPDQTLLTRHVWPWGQNLSLQHDSYLCKKYTGSVGFPTERKNEDFNFVGARAHSTVGSHRLWKKCPELCRRRKEWEYC